MGSKYNEKVAAYEKEYRKKLHTVPIHFTEDQYNQLKAAADAQNIKVGTLLKNATKWSIEKNN